MSGFLIGFVVEDAALAEFDGPGYAVQHGPDIAAGGTDVVLSTERHGIR